MAHRDILRRDATSVATGDIAEVVEQPSFEMADAHDPQETFGSRICRDAQVLLLRRYDRVRPSLRTR
jgi:hypothetical protein